MSPRHSHLSPDTAFDAYRTTKFFASLDGLRFICIAAVMFHHSPLAHHSISILTTRGFLGVDFFFVLSGFLITTLLLREEDRNGVFSLQGFYRRRALRILPVYFLVVTAVGGYYAVIKSDPAAQQIWIYYYLFLSNFLIEDIPTLSITWSLSVEEQYYMLWPVLLLLLPRKTIPTFLGVMIVLNIAIVSGVFSGLGLGPPRTEHLRFAVPTSTYSPILIGTLLAFTMHRRSGFVWVYRLAGYRFASVAALVALCLALLVLPADIRGLPNLVVHLIMAYLLATVVVRERHILEPAMTWPPIRRIGQISYGIYLYHLIVLDLVNRIAPPEVTSLGGVVFFAYFALTILIAELSFRFYETPFLQMRHPKKKIEAAVKR